MINQQGHQSTTPVEDPNTKSYTLGAYPSSDKAPASLNAAGDGVGLRELLSSSSTDLDLNFGQTTGEDAHHLSQDGFSNARRYLVQQWGDGTVCDMTGMPRRVEVQVSRSYNVYTVPVSETATVSLQHPIDRPDRPDPRNSHLPIPSSYTYASSLLRTAFPSFWR